MPIALPPPLPPRTEDMKEYQIQPTPTVTGELVDRGRSRTVIETSSQSLDMLTSSSTPPKKRKNYIDMVLTKFKSKDKDKDDSGEPQSLDPISCSRNTQTTVCENERGRPLPAAPLLEGEDPTAEYEPIDEFSLFPSCLQSPSPQQHDHPLSPHVSSSPYTGKDVPSPMRASIYTQ